MLTVHDLSFVHRPRDYGRYERLWHRLARPRRLARRAQRVLTDSDAVRAELLDEWDLAPERVRTVRPGPVGRRRARAAAAGPRAAERARRRCSPSAASSRASSRLLVEAHRLRAPSAGSAPASPSWATAPCAASSRRRARPCSAGSATAELDAAYADALCLACVSREEGFGFTPLEALAAGVPAVVSDLPVFRETLGDAALVVPPDDADALAHALLRLEREPELRESLVAAGREARPAALLGARGAGDARRLRGGAAMIRASRSSR